MELPIMLFLGIQPTGGGKSISTAHRISSDPINLTLFHFVEEYLCIFRNSFLNFGFGLTHLLSFVQLSHETLVFQSYNRTIVWLKCYTSGRMSTLDSKICVKSLLDYLIIICQHYPFMKWGMNFSSTVKLFKSTCLLIPFLFQ